MAEMKIKEILGENLVTLAEYYTGDEQKLLAVCSALDFDVLQKLKQNKELPLLFTKEELMQGVDVFPVEFLNIKLHHKILYGEDFLKDIKISKKNLRHQLEFEFRSKLIHLRSEYLMFRGKELEALILSAVPALAPIIGGLLYLKDLRHDGTRDMFDIVSKGYGMDVSILKEIYDIRRGKSKFKKDKEQYVKELINVLSGIGKIIDELEVSE
ncbi:MAG: hypothetical protein L6244_02380 [Candidatus Methanoperedenaceae archaeon]|nr:hypothetical protein [Candidatus Methanoperedenaceae archaeon]